MKIPTAAQEIVEKRLAQNKGLKEVCESYPLMKKLQLELDLDVIKFLPLQLDCKRCNANTTHHYIEDKSDIKNSQLPVSYGPKKTFFTTNTSYKLNYRCQHCNFETYNFLISFKDNLLFKSGQYPPLEISVSKDIETKLGKELSALYKKGKINYSHGLGIGAMSYYRRVIEDKMKDMLKEIEQFVPEAQKHEYIEAIKGVKDLHSFEQKADVIYEAMPAILRPPSGNYLKLLFSAVSENLHNKSDDECLEIAEEVSTLLELVISKLNQEFEASKALERISKRIKS